MPNRACAAKVQTDRADVSEQAHQTLFSPDRDFVLRPPLQAQIIHWYPMKGLRHELS